MASAKYGDLADFIDFSSIECLNADDDKPIHNCIRRGAREDESKVLESDADEQLLMTINFTQAVKIHSFQLLAPDNAGPKKIKIFANPSRSLDFDQAEEEKGTQEFELSAADLKGATKELRFVKFQNIHKLIVFVLDNQEDEETTIINKFTLIGAPLEQKGNKPSLAQQQAAAKADWLN